MKIKRMVFLVFLCVNTIEEGEPCGRLRWRPKWINDSPVGQVVRGTTPVQHKAGETFPPHDFLLVLCHSASFSLSSVPPQRRRSRGLLRLRERRPPPPGEGRLDRWLPSFLLSPSRSRTRSRSLSPSAPLPAATPLVATAPSFSRPFGRSFSSSCFLDASSCSLRRRSRSFCLSTRSASFCATWDTDRNSGENEPLQQILKQRCVGPTCSSVRGSQ